MVVLAPAVASAQMLPRLQWDANTETNIAGYVVEYGTAPGWFTNAVEVGNVTTWTLPALAPNATYYFAVRAYNTEGVRSAPSQQVQYTTPPMSALPPTTHLFWRHASSGAVATWVMNGTRQAAGIAMGPGVVADLNWRIVTTGDFNQDGNADVVWQHADGRISTWLLRGPTLLDGRLFQPDRVPPDWRIAASADMNRDGHSDLIWQHTNGSLAVWTMSGTGMREGHSLQPGQVADTSWKIAGAADFNRDGNADLLWRHSTQGHVAVWYMSGDRMISGELLTPSTVTDQAWRIVSVTDMSGDGAPDIIWQHDDGRLAAWIMNGSTSLGTVPLTPDVVADTGWRVVGGR